jgi:hypothetical protein
MISQKNISSLDIYASECMSIMHQISEVVGSAEPHTEHMAIDMQLMHNIASNYLLMYKEILYSKQFPHRKFIQENRTKH